MANDNDSVDSNGNSTDLRPRRSNRSKGKSITQVEETDDNIVVNNVAYKVGDFAFYLDKKQDIYRIGLIEEFKFQKRDKLTNKKAEISIKQFYRLDEIPPSVLSNEGEFDTHVMPQSFPDWLRLREIFISDNTLSTPLSSLRGMCTVRHFPDLNHAMALFSSTQSSGLNSSPRVDHHSLLNGKDGSIPIPKQRDDNTFFYVYSYNARGRKLTATYLEIRVGPSYQAELPDYRPPDDMKSSDIHGAGRVWEQLLWEPNQIPEEVFNVYNMATISIACFSGFGGGVDDSASMENGRKIASHMLTQQKALDCLHKAQYNMEKAVEIFAENSLPETNKIPFLWTDEDHTMFDESVKIHGKNFLRISQDKRNKKCRIVGDFVTFYYYWKKNRPKNRKYAAKKNLRSRIAPNAMPVASSDPGDNIDASKSQEPISTVATQSESANKTAEHSNSSPGAENGQQEICVNCKSPLPKYDPSDEKMASLTDRMRVICGKCQHYLRRYGYHRPTDDINEKGSDNDEDGVDFEDEALNGFDEEDEEEPEGEEDDDEEALTSVNSPSTCKDIDDTNGGLKLPASSANVIDNKNTLAINKYDFDEEDKNVEEVSSLLKRNQAKHHNNILRDSDSTKQSSNYKVHTNGSAGIFTSKSSSTSSGYHQSKSNSFKNSNFAGSVLSATGAGAGAATSSATGATSSHIKSSKSANIATMESTPSKSSMKRTSMLKGKTSGEHSKKRKVDNGDDVTSSTPTTRSSSVSGRSSLLSPTQNTSSKPITSSLSNQSHNGGTSGGGSTTTAFGKKQKSDLTCTYDSSSSSSSSSSNDSSSSDEGDNLLATAKKAVGGSVAKFGSGKQSDGVSGGANKDGSIKLLDQSSSSTTPTNSIGAVNNATSKEPAGIDNSYNQMITAVPNIPGVCAVTNIGEPMPQMMHNISTDLSSTQSSSSLSDLNITVAEPLYKQLSLRHAAMPMTTTTTSSTLLSGTANAIISDHATLFTTPKTTAIMSNSAGGNFNASVCSSMQSGSSNQRLDTNPEETGLNLVVVKPKKRAENAFNEHNWAPPHDSPSKLVHYRGDSSVADPTVGEVPKQVINGNEIVYNSRTGSLVRTIKLTEGYSCARTDLQHTRSGLRPDDIEQHHQYIATAKLSEPSSFTASNSSCSVVSSMASQDLSRQKISSMPPPTDKLHHPPTAVKHLTTPPLTHSHANIPTSPINPSAIPSPAHSRKIGSSNPPSHTLRSPSPAGSRSQTAFSSGSVAAASNMGMRSNHMHNSPLMSSSSASNAIRPPPGLMNHNMQQAVPNNSLLIDYVNMNKVANDLLIYQAMAQSYEEMQKQEIQKYLLMSTGMPGMTNNLLNRAMWDQRERFGGGGNDGWSNNLPPLSMHPPADMSSIMRALTQSQNSANTQNRPRSATGGLNLSNLTNAPNLAVPGGSNSGSNAPGGADKPGSGRASVNHINAGEFQQRQDALVDNPELLEGLLRLMADSSAAAGAHMNPNAAALIHMLNSHKSAGLHQQSAPPSAHGLANLAAGAAANFPSNLAAAAANQQHLSVLSHLAATAAQSPSAGSVVKPPSASFAAAAAAAAAANGPPRPNLMDFLMYQNGAFNRNQPR